MGARLAREHQANLLALGAQGCGTPPKRTRRALARRTGLVLVRMGRRLAGPDELLDRRLATWTRTGWQRP
jgi:hypothetical protein